MTFSLFVKDWNSMSWELFLIFLNTIEHNSLSSITLYSYDILKLHASCQNILNRLIKFIQISLSLHLKKKLGRIQKWNMSFFLLRNFIKEHVLVYCLCSLMCMFSQWFCCSYFLPASLLDLKRRAVKVDKGVLVIVLLSLHWTIKLKKKKKSKGQMQSLTMNS